MIDVTTAEVLDWLTGLPDGLATAVFCDSPYGIGFRDWDHGVPPVEVWREVLRVCKPGALLMSFGGTRTHHRLAVNIEDAGFSVFDTLMWVHSQQGRPKGHSISKNGGGLVWEGWDVALKPAWDPIILCRAPRAEKVGETALVHGTGGLWIDGGRIEIDPHEREIMDKRGNVQSGRSFDWQGPRVPSAVQYRAHEGGRWPTNVLLSCECESLEHDGSCPVSILDDGAEYSRFFYKVKASRHERDAGLEGMPTVKLRDDLTPEQRDFVLVELKRLGVRSLFVQGDE